MQAEVTWEIAWAADEIEFNASYRREMYHETNKRERM